MSSVTLCSDFVGPNLLAVGTFHKELAIYDYRMPVQHWAISNLYHKGAVHCVKSPYCLSSGVEGQLSSGFPSTTTLDFSDADSMGDVSMLETSVNISMESTNSNSSIVSAGDSLPTSSPSQNIALYSGCKTGIIAAWDLRKFNVPVTEFKVFCGTNPTF